MTCFKTFLDSLLIVPTVLWICTSVCITLVPCTKTALVHGFLENVLKTVSCLTVPVPVYIFNLKIYYIYTYIYVKRICGGVVCAGWYGSWYRRYTCNKIVTDMV